MTKKSFEEELTKRKKPYNRAVEKRHYFQEYINTYKLQKFDKQGI